HPFLKNPVLEEAYVKNYPKTAMVYPIRNETHGLFERIHYSFSGNKLPQTDLWILSDSSEEFEPYEKELVRRLEQYHSGHVFYRRRKNPSERKQGNIAEFLGAHPQYTYLYICDADGMVPKRMLLKLLRKAEHPENQDIAIFQSSIRIAHAKTWYARFERIGTRFAQRLNFTAYQAIFSRSISFGHHHLARASLLAKIELPKGLLSHDNWDTAILDQMGYRVAFCPDVYAFDEAPASYLEARARSQRWAQGTLQGIPLIFMHGITLASRFLAFYGIYLYLADIVFFFWAIMGVMAHSAVAGELIHFQIDSIWLGLFTNSLLKWILVFSVAVVFCHKFSILRNFKDFREYLYELFASTFLTLNNFIYAPLNLLSLPLKKISWIPMAKDPFAKVCFWNTAKKLWLGTAFGLFGLHFCVFETPYFIWQATPILVCLIVSIPMVYLTAQPMPERFRRWI
ncbi:MAG: glycosyltransferase, partial [Candidatus Omnitrophica bacterium]|nr:glycosyltransferase [Candidatus Omnitrophota bacterium]